MAISQSNTKQSNTITKVRGDINTALDWSQPVFASLVPVVAGTNTIDLSSDQQGPGRFLLNPSSWEENKTSNWVFQTIPGQSDPIAQWISSGPRTVNFEALVTLDFADFGVSSVSPAVVSKTSTTIGNIASQFFGVTLPTTANFSSTAPPPNGESPDDLDISHYLNYYRSLLYPVYSNSILQYSPPLLVLYTGSTFINKPNGTSIRLTSTVWVLTNLKIKVTKQLQNLTPIEALVEFQLTQYNINSTDRNSFSPFSVSTIATGGVPKAAT